MPEHLLPPTVIWTVVFTLVLLGGAIIRFPFHFDLSAPQILIPIIFFVAIGLGPWIGIITGRWVVSGIMSWWWVPEVFRFLALYIVVFWLGFWVSFGISNKKSEGLLKSAKHNSPDLLLISPRHLLFLSIGFWLCQAIPMGKAIWLSEVPRGYGQWNEWQISQYVALFGMMGLLLCNVLSGIAWARGGSKFLIVVPILQMVLLAASLSRGTFVPLLLFVMAAHLSGLKVKRQFLYSCLLMLLVAGGSFIVRGNSETPGLYRLLHGINNNSFAELPEAVLASISWLDTITTAFSLRDVSINPLDGFLEWLWTLLPIPTFWGWLDRSAVSLASVMGIEGGSTGIPFPFLGEIFYKMGWWGVLAGFIVGGWFGYLQKKVHAVLWSNNKPRWQFVFLYVISLYGLILSFHTATRAATRPLLYAVMLIYLHRLVVKFNARVFIHRKGAETNHAHNIIHS